MLIDIVKKLIAKNGYELRRIQCEATDRTPSVTLHKYLDSNGAFDYERYKAIQTAGNKNFLQNMWAAEENISFLAAYIERLIGSPLFGICHGTRQGKEQEWFRKYLACEVIGTEISDTATQFPHTIQWDFHEVNPEWLASADFIYSNSFDHSYDPEKCLNAWMSCVRRGGICIVEHSTMHDTRGATQLDPFGASILVMPYLIAKWSKGSYVVREILDAPNLDPVRRFLTPTEDAYLNFIVIQNL